MFCESKYFEKKREFVLVNDSDLSRALVYSNAVMRLSHLPPLAFELAHTPVNFLVNYNL